MLTVNRPVPSLWGTCYYVKLSGDTYHEQTPEVLPSEWHCIDPAWRDIVSCLSHCVYKNVLSIRIFVLYDWINLHLLANVEVSLENLDEPIQLDRHVSHCSILTSIIYFILNRRARQKIYTVMVSNKVAFTLIVTGWPDTGGAGEIVTLLICTRSERSSVIYINTKMKTACYSEHTTDRVWPTFSLPIGYFQSLLTWQVRRRRVYCDGPCLEGEQSVHQASGKTIHWGCVKYIWYAPHFSICVGEILQRHWSSSWMVERIKKDLLRR
jgi:hypothetical protein